MRPVLRLAAVLAAAVLVPSAVRAQAFVVPTDEDEELDETPAPRRKGTAEEPAKKPRKVAEDAEEAPRAWTEQAPKRGIQVIEENTAVGVDVRPEDLQRDRQGRPLSGGGIGIVPRQESGSFTFKANEEVDEDEEEEVPRAKKAAPRDTRPAAKGDAVGTRAPTGMLVPTDDDGFEETAAPPPPSRRNPLETGSRVGNVPQGSDFVRPVDRGSGASIRVEEVELPRTDDLTVRAPPKQEKAKPVERIVAPPPEKPSRAVAQPKPAEPKPAEPENSQLESIEVVGTQAKPEPARPVANPDAAPQVVTAPAAPDPFQKLEKDLEAVEGPRAKVEEPAPRRRREQPVAEPEPTQPGTPPRRDPSIVGLSVGLGGGVLLANDSRGVLAPQLAYGLTATYSPGFLPELLLDLSAWRVGVSGGTPFTTVDSSLNHFAIRALYAKELGSNVHALLGGGVLLSLNTERYAITDGTLRESFASFVRPGGDLTMGLAYFGRPLEVRLDVRVLVRGGLRLEVLPGVVIGASF